MSKVILPIEIIAHINSFLPRRVHRTAKCFHSIIRHFNSDIIDFFNCEKRLNFYKFCFKLRGITYWHKLQLKEGPYSEFYIQFLIDFKKDCKELYFVMNQLLLHKNKNPWKLNENSRYIDYVSYE